MAVDSWEPAPDSTSTNTDKAVLRRYAALMAGDSDTPLSEKLDDAAQQHCAALMQIPDAAWQEIAAQLDNADLRGLIRFFTLAEMQLNNCEAGAASPVIAINRVLKQRGEPLDRDELIWIRNHSSNRFLPNGPL